MLKRWVFILALVTASPAAAQEYGAVKQRLSDVAKVTGLFMDSAQYAFDERDTAEGCRQLYQARKELSEAVPLLAQLRGMPEAADPDERRSIEDGFSTVRSSIENINGTIRNRCENYPE